MKLTVYVARNTCFPLNNVVNPKTLGGNSSLPVLPVHVNEESALVFETKDAGPGLLGLRILSGKHERVPLRQVRRGDAHQVVCLFRPPGEGEYTVEVAWSGHAVPLGPLACHTPGHALASRVRVAGDGLNAATVGRRAEFEVDLGRVHAVATRDG